jgi:hypothetical protein
MTSSAELRAKALRIGAELRADILERKAAGRRERIGIDDNS